MTTATGYIRVYRCKASASIAVGLAVLLALDVAPAQSAALAAETAAEQIALRFEPSGGSHYTGVCRLRNATGEETFALDGTGPSSHRYAGQALTCRIVANGRLSVEITKGDGNVSRTTTSGGTISVSVQ